MCIEAAIDLNRLERNLRRMQDHCRQHNFRSHPHIKTAPLVEFAQRQVAFGEAEVIADAGLDDILISDPMICTVRRAPRRLQPI